MWLDWYSGDIYLFIISYFSFIKVTHVALDKYTYSLTPLQANNNANYHAQSLKLVLISISKYIVLFVFIKNAFGLSLVNMTE